ncbi:MAG TPA: hypothetical protein ENF24_00450 [Methanosarcinales archaeon]|nr:hypothetical protein [Methanosarcinales archaeon]
MNENAKNLIRRVYALGFDVGYHHHSEVGWVSSTYADLTHIVSAAAHRDLLRKYYEKGKIDGEVKRRRDIRAGSRESDAKSRDSVAFDYETASSAVLLMREPQILARTSQICLTALLSQPMILRGFMMPDDPDPETID